MNVEIVVGLVVILFVVGTVSSLIFIVNDRNSLVEEFCEERGYKASFSNDGPYCYKIIQDQKIKRYLDIDICLRDYLKPLLCFFWQI